MGAPARAAVAPAAAAVGAITCAGILIAGCGGSGSPSGLSSSAPASDKTEPTSTALITSMQASVRHANSVHIAGHVTSHGIPITVNLDMHRNGDISGTVRQNGAPFNVISVHSAVYIKATRSFLHAVRAPSSACAVVCGKWLQLTSTQAKQLAGDLSMSSITTPLTSGQVPELTRAGSKTIDGQRAWELQAADGSVLLVRSANPHYPVEATTGGRPGEDVLYSRWNTAPNPVAPPANQVLNLNNLSP